MTITKNSGGSLYFKGANTILQYCKSAVCKVFSQSLSLAGNAGLPGMAVVPNKWHLNAIPTQKNIYTIIIDAHLATAPDYLHSLKL